MQLRPRDPESKGIVERRNGFFETSFMPGRVFSSPADFNTQFDGWLTTANGRVVRTIKARPADLIEADRAAMLPLPAIPPPLGWCHQVRLGRDYYVRLAASDYSVDPTAIGRLVEVTADLERVSPRRLAAGRRPRPGLGPRVHRDRSRSCPDRPAAAGGVPSATGPGTGQ